MEITPFAWLIGIVSGAFALTVALFAKYYLPKDMPSLDNDPFVPIETFEPMPTAEVVYEVAKASLGQDLTPRDEISDEVACVVQWEEIIHKALGYYLGGEKPEASTWGLFNLLEKDPRWKAISAPQKGCTILYVTGTGNDKVRGHALIMGEKWAMSNTSANGLWQANYTLDGLKRRFETSGGMSPHYYLPL